MTRRIPAGTYSRLPDPTCGLQGREQRARKGNHNYPTKKSAKTGNNRTEGNTKGDRTGRGRQASGRAHGLRGRL